MTSKNKSKHTYLFRLLQNRHKLDVKVQRGAARNDPAGASSAVPQVRRNDELTLTTHLHSGHVVVAQDPKTPSFNDLICAKRQRRTAFVGRIKHAPVLQASRVVRLDRLPLHRRCALAHDGIAIRQSTLRRRRLARALERR